jgi:hypothetical protein
MFETNVVEDIKIHIFCSVTFFFENHAVYEIMWKNTVEGGRPLLWQYDACALHAEFLRLQIHTLKLCNIHCFSTATMVGRTRRHVTYVVYCLPCSTVRPAQRDFLEQLEGTSYQQNGIPTLKLSRCLWNLTRTYIQAPCTNCIYSNTYRRHLETNEYEYTPRHYPLLQIILQDIKPVTAHSSWTGYVFRVPCFRITVS